nr:hypothetical protein [Tanacetum cinerariifolium]
ASSSNNTRVKPSVPSKTLQEHSLLSTSGSQNPIALPAEQTGRIVNSRDILLIQGMCTFQGLRSEDPLCHIRHYLSIVDNIQADEATRDTLRLHFFYFSHKGKMAEWLNKIPPTQITTWDQLLAWETRPVRSLLFKFFYEEEDWNRIEEYVQYQDDLWDEPSPPMNISSISGVIQPTFKGRLKRASIAGINLFDDEASSSNNTRVKPSVPSKTLQEHSLLSTSGSQNPIALPAEQTGRIVNSRDILLIQGMCTFQGLRSEDPLCHIRHYLSIVDNIQADEATRDTLRLHFFYFSHKGKMAEWLNKIPPTQITTWDQLLAWFLDYFFPVGRTL